MRHLRPSSLWITVVLMRFLQSTVDAVYTNVKLQCMGSEEVYGTLQTELTFQGKDGGGSTFLPAYGDLCSESTKFDDAQRVYFCKNCLQNCAQLVEQAPKNILIVADVKAPNTRVSWFHVQTPVSNIRETGKQCNVENASPVRLNVPPLHKLNKELNSASNMEETSTDALRSFSKTSVLFVSISFIILMVISLAWLVFYYVQRFRYAHAKDRLQRRLFNAARKALTRIPTMTIAPNMTQELQSDCAVCLDPYQLQDVVRILPCKHIYHKSCIDPWLLEHRTCPMCKNDILKHFGYWNEIRNDIQMPVNSRGIVDDYTIRLELGDERQHHHRGDNPEMIIPEGDSVTSADSAGFSFDHSDHPENFSFNSPTVPPQLVLNATNAKTFMPLSSRSARNGSLGDLNSAVTVTPTQRPLTSGGSPGQIVNLVQVKSRSASITRAAATIRKESLPTPIEITTSTVIPATSSSSGTTTTTATSSNTQVI